MKILIVEDDAEMSILLKNSLTTKNHTVEVADNGGDGSFLGKSYEYDVIILDYSLPKKDGLRVCREIRDCGKSTPILFLSATESVQTKISALESGADDYMVKPFSLEELHARLQALNRRPDIKHQSILTIGKLTLNLDTHIVTLNKKIIHFTRKELSVLEYLMKHQGTIVSRALIMEYVWTMDSDLLSNTVESHIRNIRKKIYPILIMNVSGRGYVIPE